MCRSPNGRADPVRAASGTAAVTQITAPVGPAADRELVLNTILQTNDNVEVEVGDVVRYVDVLKPEDVLSVRITNHPSDLAAGLISVNTPLAQALLGALVGDEASLHLPGRSRRLFRIISISKPEIAAAA